MPRLSPEEATFIIIIAIVVLGCVFSLMALVANWIIKRRKHLKK